MNNYIQTHMEGGETFEVEIDDVAGAEIILRVKYPPTGDDDPGFTEIVMSAGTAYKVAQFLMNAANQATIPLTAEPLKRSEGWDEVGGRYGSKIHGLPKGIVIAHLWRTRLTFLGVNENTPISTYEAFRQVLPPPPEGFFNFKESGQLVP